MGTLEGDEDIVFGSYLTLGETTSEAATILGNNVKPSTAVNSVIHMGVDAGNFIRMVYHTGITFNTNITSTVGADTASSTNERMRIDLNGNVGIGTTGPSQKLDVAGNMNITGTIQNGSTVFLESAPATADIYANIRVLRSKATQADGMYD